MDNSAKVFDLQIKFMATELFQDTEGTITIEQLIDKSPFADVLKEWSRRNNGIVPLNRIRKSLIAAVDSLQTQGIVQWVSSDKTKLSIPPDNEEAVVNSYLISIPQLSQLLDLQFSHIGATDQTDKALEDWTSEELAKGYSDGRLICKAFYSNGQPAQLIMPHDYMSIWLSHRATLQL